MTERVLRLLRRWAGSDHPAESGRYEERNERHGREAEPLDRDDDHSPAQQPDESAGEALAQPPLS